MLLPVEVIFVSREIHDAGVRRLLDAGRRRVSLVDAVSFEVMRARRIEEAFAFDDFEREGFTRVPGRGNATR
jgi:predicted nucleic acid-binding protein